MAIDKSELRKRYKEEKQRQREQQKNKNPEGLFTGRQMEIIIGAVKGIKSRMGIDEDDSLAALRFPESRYFSKRLFKNLKKASEELSIIYELCPKYPKDLEAEIKDFQAKKLNIAKDNAGIPRDKNVESIKLGEIRAEGNEKIYNAEIKSLEESYKKALKRKERIDKDVDAILKAHLANPEFIMIDEDDIPTELNVAEIEAIWPMIKEEK